MFKDLTKELNEYATSVDAIKKEFKEKAEYLHNSFNINGTIFIDEYAKAKNLYERSLANSKTKCMENVNRILEDIKNKIDSVVVSKVDSNAIAEVELLRSIKVTQAELDAYVKKYSNSYLVLKVLGELGEEKGLKVSKLLGLEEYDEYIAEAKKWCKHVVDKYEGKYTNYMCDLILTGRIFEDYDEQFASLFKLYN